MRARPDPPMATNASTAANCMSSVIALLIFAGIMSSLALSTYLASKS